MVKVKKEPISSYRRTIYSMQNKENKDVIEQKLRDKGVRVGEEGYNVKALKSEYRKEKAKEVVGKVVGKLSKAYDTAFNSRLKNRAILKKQGRATYVIDSNQGRSYHFKQEFANTANLLGWK